MNTSLQDWINGQNVGDEMRWKGAWGAQVQFFRDQLAGVASSGLEDFDERRALARVISTHRSKSIELPVVSFLREDLGLQLVVRGNFYDYKLTCISKKPIEADFSGLFHTTVPVAPEYTGNELSSCYFEGFPGDLIHGYYEENKCKWSASIGRDEALWMTVFLIMRSLGAIKPRIWHTEESHRIELDAERERNRIKDAAREARRG